MVCVTFLSTLDWYIPCWSSLCFSLQGQTACVTKVSKIGQCKIQWTCFVWNAIFHWITIFFSQVAAAWLLWLVKKLLWSNLASLLWWVLSYWCTFGETSCCCVIEDTEMHLGEAEVPGKTGRFDWQGLDCLLGGGVMAVHARALDMHNMDRMIGYLVMY